MYNKFHKELKPLIVLSVIAIAAIAIGFGIEFPVLLFINCVTLLVLPICLKDNNISLKIKIFVSVSVGIASVLVINYLAVRQRIMCLYIIYFFIAIVFSTVSNLRNKRD